MFRVIGYRRHNATVSQPGRGVPIYLQLAALLREQIARGDLAPGEMVPGENQLREDYRVSRTTAAKALDQLAAEGLIKRRPGIGSEVLDGPGGTEIQVPPGTVIAARMPRPGADEGWRPVLSVTRPGQPEEHYDAMRTVAVSTGDHDPADGARPSARLRAQILAEYDAEAAARILALIDGATSPDAARPRKSNGGHG